MRFQPVQGRRGVPFPDALWQLAAMRTLHLFMALLLAAAAASGAPLASSPKQAAAVADEAVAAALTLPPGYKRDVVLRAVSRNLRWFGQPDAGLRAARAMTDRGVGEVPLGARLAPPRYVPLKEAMPTGSPCDAGVWREDDGSDATTPAARDAWAERCLLTRDFHYIGLPDIGLMRTVATGLPAGETKAGVLAMLIRHYGDADTLRFVTGEIGRNGASLPAKARAALAEMLAEPEMLYRLGRKSEALAAARTARSFQLKAELIALLVRDNDPASAIAVFDTLAATPPEFGDTCYGWFGPIGGLRLAYVGNAMKPSPGLGGFLDRLPASATFRRACPQGLDAELAVSHLLAAGRLDAAIVRAREESAQPFLLVDALLQVGRARLSRGERDLARAHAIEAGAALPPFDPGDPVVPRKATDVPVVVTLPSAGAGGPTRNFGERSGDTHRRFHVIQLLAATGAVAEADALARVQPAGGLRAVALSAAVAGRAGLRFDDQAPTLSEINKDDL